MKKETIRLAEGELTKMIAEAVKKMFPPHMEVRWNPMIDPDIFRKWNDEDFRELAGKYRTARKAILDLQEYLGQRYPELNDACEEMYRIIYEEIGDRLELNEE